MQVIQHIGAHATDDERLIKSLMKNAKELSAEGIQVPAPLSYRPLLRESVAAQMDGTAGPDAKDKLIAGITGADRAERLVLSNPAFICTPNRVFEGREFYGQAGMKVRALAQAFAPDPVQVFMATRNPATFIPALLSQSRATTVTGYLGGLDPESLSWSELVQRIRTAAPDVPITVWCNEDTPLIWSRILRAMTGVTFDTPLDGAYDLLNEIMTDEGQARFSAYLKTHPPKTEAQSSRIVAAFLDKFAKADEVVEEVDAPEWNAEQITRITLNYEADIARLDKIEGVTVLSP